MSKGAGRAHITHRPSLSRFAKNPATSKLEGRSLIKDVAGQPKPTPDQPIRMHKRAAGA